LSRLDITGFKAWTVNLWRRRDVNQLLSSTIVIHLFKMNTINIVITVIWGYNYTD